MTAFLKRQWFLSALLAVVAATVADATQTIPGVGLWLRDCGAPSAVIFIIFLLSGGMLDARQLRAGLREVKGTLAALGVIFVFSPAAAAALGLMPLPVGIKIGLFLVAAMPTTLSSGVVMTGAAGGNMAHALVVTVAANSLAVVAVPVVLPMLLPLAGASAEVTFDRLAMMVRLAGLVLLPLGMGLVVKWRLGKSLDQWGTTLQRVCQGLIVVMVWIGAAGSRKTLLGGAGDLWLVAALASGFHALLLAGSWFSARVLSMGPGRRESLIFMGAQKTLTLTLILQVSLFPSYGQALVMIVVHHIVHLMMDGYLVGRFKSGRSG
jgi:predicted Na+-dependent transporter